MTWLGGSGVRAAAKTKGQLLPSALPRPVRASACAARLRGPRALWDAGLGGASSVGGPTAGERIEAPRNPNLKCLAVWASIPLLSLRRRCWDRCSSLYSCGRRQFITFHCDLAEGVSLKVFQTAPLMSFVLSTKGTNNQRIPSRGFLRRLPPRKLDTRT